MRGCNQAAIDSMSAATAQALELLFKNPGRRWESVGRLVYDHDFRSDSSGIAIPYGIYDVTENRGAVVVGVSHDTPAFAAHAIAHGWHQEGCPRYRGSRQLLILADTGGSNGCRCYAWKTELQSQLANSFALAVTVAHYPTGTPRTQSLKPRPGSAGGVESGG
jgi:hypothetical protein